VTDKPTKSLPKALCIVEGADDEPRLLKRMSAVCGLDLEMEIVPVRSNIHQLYQILAEGDFQLDIRKVLAALPTIPAEQRARLSDTRFAYTYLMYDAELQHRYPGEEQLPLSDIVRGNLVKLEKMCAYFTDETDPTVGRLYINWPMVESYRDCDDFFDPNYRDNFVALSDLATYKARVGQRKHASLNLSKYDTDAFHDLARMNICKIAALAGNDFAAPSYADYLRQSTSSAIFIAQQAHIATDSQFGVLNTTVLLPVDYFGYSTCSCAAR